MSAPPFAQRRQGQVHNIDAVEQILPNVPSQFHFQDAVGRAHRPHFTLLSPVRDAADCPFVAAAAASMQRRSIGNFVKKQCPACAISTRPVSSRRPRVNAPFRTRQFTFQQRSWIAGQFTFPYACSPRDRHDHASNDVLARALSPWMSTARSRPPLCPCAPAASAWSRCSRNDRLGGISPLDCTSDYEFVLSWPRLAPLASVCAPRRQPRGW